KAGFAAENAAGVPVDAAERNYRDANHKPEMLVALSEVTALSGFRPLDEAEADLRALATASKVPALAEAADGLARRDDETARREFLEWAFSGSPEVGEALDGIAGAVLGEHSTAEADAPVNAERME